MTLKDFNQLIDRIEAVVKDRSLAEDLAIEIGDTPKILDGEVLILLDGKEHTLPLSVLGER